MKKLMLMVTMVMLSVFLQIFHSGRNRSFSPLKDRPRSRWKKISTIVTPGPSSKQALIPCRRSSRLRRLLLNRLLPREKESRVRREARLWAPWWAKSPMMMQAREQAQGRQPGPWWVG